MSQTCSIEKCFRTSRGLCDCCQQHLCLQHLNEHNASLISQLNPLTDEINALEDRLKTLNIQKIIDNSRQKLKQWRQDCHRRIDSYFEQKCQELDQLVKERVAQRQEELNRIHLKIDELINTQETTRQDIDSLTSTIRQLETNMNNTEQICFTINARPLLIDDMVVFIEKTTEHELHLSTLSPVYRTVLHPEGSFQSVTSNDRHLLMHQHPNLCLLDREMNIVKQTLWSYSEIWDMCWSSTLDRFIVLEENDIFLINENTMSIDNVYTIKERSFMSCTCSDTVLFVSINEWGSTIIELTLFPAIERIRKWKSPLTCAKDEGIDGIVYNDGNLGLMVKNALKKSLRIELRHAKTLEHIWSFQLDTACIQKIAFRCCSLPCNEWLIVEYDTGHLIQVTADGKIKKTIIYHPNPYRATLFDLNKLVVSTMNDVRLHMIE